MQTTELRLITSRRERRSQLAARLGGLSGRLQSARAPHAVMELLVDGVARACGARHVAAQLFDDDGAVRLTGAQDLRGTMGAGSSFDCMSALRGVSRTRRAQWYRNRSALLAALPECSTMDRLVTSLVALPLADADHLLGAFVVAYDDHHLLSDDDLEFLLLTINLAARALARIWPALPHPSLEGNGTICFVPVNERERLIDAAARESVDLGRLVRLVARRALAASPMGDALTCEADERIRGRWDRAWLETTLARLVTLARRLGPGPLHLEAWSDGESAVVDVLCGTAPPARRSDRIDLAAMTSASEEWTLGRWLWQGVARREGAQLSVLQDANAPCGLRLRLPRSRFSLWG